MHGNGTGWFHRKVFAINIKKAEFTNRNSTAQMSCAESVLNQMVKQPMLPKRMHLRATKRHITQWPYQVTFRVSHSFVPFINLSQSHIARCRSATSYHSAVAGVVGGAAVGLPAAVGCIWTAVRAICGRKVMHTYVRFWGHLYTGQISEKDEKKILKILEHVSCAFIDFLNWLMIYSVCITKRSTRHGAHVVGFETQHKMPHCYCLSQCADMKPGPAAGETCQPQTKLRVHKLYSPWWWSTVVTGCAALRLNISMCTREAYADHAFINNAHCCRLSSTSRSHRCSIPIGTHCTIPVAYFHQHTQERRRWLCTRLLLLSLLFLCLYRFECV